MLEHPRLGDRRDERSAAREDGLGGTGIWLQLGGADLRRAAQHDRLLPRDDVRQRALVGLVEQPLVELGRTLDDDDLSAHGHDVVVTGEPRSAEPSAVDDDARLDETLVDRLPSRRSTTVPPSSVRRRSSHGR